MFNVEFKKINFNFDEFLFYQKKTIRHLNKMQKNKLDQSGGDFFTDKVDQIRSDIAQINASKQKVLFTKLLETITKITDAIQFIASQMNDAKLNELNSQILAMQKDVVDIQTQLDA